MNQVVRTALLSTLLPVLAFTSPAPQAEETIRENLHYIGLYGTLLNHRSAVEIVEVDDRRVRTTTEGWGSGATLVVGHHITERFHVEVRAGMGLEDADLRPKDAKLAIDYYASWYIGMHYPLTDYANVYGQFGFSHIQGEAKLTSAEAVEDFPGLSEDFPDSSFSVSWLAGLDFEILDHTYLVLEGGKLFEDTPSDINTFQFSGGLRYEF